MNQAPTIELTAEDYQNMLKIISVGSFNGSESEYISVLKYRIGIKLQEFAPPATSGDATAKPKQDK